MTGREGPVQPEDLCPLDARMWAALMRVPQDDLGDCTQWLLFVEEETVIEASRSRIEQGDMTLVCLEALVRGVAADVLCLRGYEVMSVWESTSQGWVCWVKTNRRIAALLEWLWAVPAVLDGIGDKE